MVPLVKRVITIGSVMLSGTSMVPLVRRVITISRPFMLVAVFAVLVPPVMRVITKEWQFQEEVTIREYAHRSLDQALNLRMELQYWYQES